MSSLSTTTEKFDVGKPLAEVRPEVYIAGDLRNVPFSILPQSLASF